MDKNLREFSKRIGFLIPNITREVFKRQQKILTMGDVTFPQLVVLEYNR